MADSKVTDVLSEPRVIVGLDFGTTFSGFAYAHISDPDKIYTYYNYPMTHAEKPYCKTLTGCYYKQPGGPGSPWVLKSWGYPARAEYEKDLQNVRRHRSAGAADDPLKPSVGVYLTRFKLHLANRDFGQSSAQGLPAGFTVDRVISDYLREMGVIILKTLQDNYGDGMSKEAIKWCVTVPSIWDNSAKQQMKTCMIEAGLVDGVDGSPHPVTVVLEPEAASFHCHKSMSEQRLEVGDRLLVADIGGGTADIVVQEVVSTGEDYRVKEVTTSSGGLCGGTYVDLKFIEFLRQKIGPCLAECMMKNLGIYPMLIKRWEEIKVSFGEPSLKGDPRDVNLPHKLVADWEAYDEKMRNPPRDVYDELEISYEELQSIFDPVISQNLQLISRQLAQAGGVKVMVVVGGFAGSPYLLESIKERFCNEVPHIISPPNPGSAVCQGAVALALNPNVIVSRFARKTFGFLCVRTFEEGIDPPEYREVIDGTVKCNNRFSIYVKKDAILQVDESVSKIHKPVYRGQRTMKFELFSSTDVEPRYTLGDSVTKEGEITIDISADEKLDKDRLVKLSLFFGRSALEVKAEAMNFSAGGPQKIELPVSIGYQ